MSDEYRGTYSADERKAMAAKGHAMPDGSYPIDDADDVESAAKLAGHSKNYSYAEVKAHVIKNARRIGATSALPKDWVQTEEEQQQQKRRNLESPPADELYRAIMTGGVALQPPDDRDGRLGTLHGHFTKFNQWAAINSRQEGNFLERIAPGAFTKTFQERGGIKCLFQHGKDPQVGDKPLGPIEVLREDDTGPYYEVPLLDTSYNRDLIPGLEAGLYGASFRFQVMRQAFKKKGERGYEGNEDGLPERTVIEVRTKEFGPVTFPAYVGATAGIRSMTDEFHLIQLTRDAEYLKQLISYVALEDNHTDEYNDEADAPRETRRAASAPVSGRRVHTGQPYLYGTQKRREPSWLLPR